MHNTGAKPQLRKCYQKVYIYEVILFSSIFTQLYSIIILLCIIALINCWFFPIRIQRGERWWWVGSFFSKNANFGKGGPSSANMYEKGRSAFQKRKILCKRNNWMASKVMLLLTAVLSKTITLYVLFTCGTNGTFKQLNQCENISVNFSLILKYHTG